MAAYPAAAAPASSKGNGSGCHAESVGGFGRSSMIAGNATKRAALVEATLAKMGQRLAEATGLAVGQPGADRARQAVGRDRRAGRVGSRAGPRRADHPREPARPDRAQAVVVSRPSRGVLASRRHDAFEAVRPVRRRAALAPHLAGERLLPRGCVRRKACRTRSRCRRRTSPARCTSATRSASRCRTS